MKHKFSAWRRFARMAALAAGLSMIAGCAGVSGQAANSGDNGKGVRLTYWLWDSAQLPPYRACAKAFMDKNPDINVEIIQYGWDDYWTQLTATMVGEAAPDIFVNHTSQFAKFASLGQLLDLEPMVKKDNVDLKQYEPGLADLWQGQSGGHRYGLPKDWDTEALFYNQKMLKDAGITEAEMQNLTWNPKDGGTFEKVIAKLTVDKNGKHGDEPGFDKTKVATYGIGYNESGGAYGQVQWSMYAIANGWHYGDKNPWPTKWNYDDPKLVETIKWWRSLIEKGYMPPFSVATSGVGTIESLSSGAYASLFEGSWNISNIVNTKGGPFKAAPTPIGPLGKRASVMNGVGDSIWSGTKHPKEAWEFVKFMGTQECQGIVADAGIVFPARHDVLPRAEAAFAKLGVDPKAFSIHVKDGTTALSPVADNWQALATIMKPAMDTVMIEMDQDPMPILQDATRRANQLMKPKK